jgi:glycosyltransferase involved in cell wall biosynthesis
MLNILISAYAVGPNRGSEPGMAWNWIVNLSKYCNLYVVTEGEFQSDIENELKRNNINNIMFFYVSVSDDVRRLCWNQGDWRFYSHYRKWQKEILKTSSDIVATYQIDLIHHLNMIGFREPGYLYTLNKPFVVGPIGGFGHVPINYTYRFPAVEFIQNLMRPIINYYQLRFGRVRKAYEKASMIIAANSTSIYNLNRLYKHKTKLINETGLYFDDQTQTKVNDDFNTFKVVWIGKDVPRKMLNIALDVFKDERFKNVELNIIGVKRQGDSYKNIKYFGWINHKQVQDIIKSSHLLLFTSLLEGTPHVVLESLSKGKPVICFDVCGQGDVVNEHVGFKIIPTTYGKSVKQISEIITDIIDDKEKYKNMCHNTSIEASKHTWEMKANMVSDIYKEIIKSI